MANETKFNIKSVYVRLCNSQTIVTNSSVAMHTMDGIPLMTTEQHGYLEMATTY